MVRSRSFDDQFAWATEKEPSYQGRPRPIIPLSVHGAVKQYMARRAPLLLCPVCERSVAAEGRCATCEARDLRRVECECCWLAPGEAHACGKEAA
jgi:hypothetical protein